jgi:hypothetical protein
MNPFINPKKRGVSLPKGCKDLADVLRRLLDESAGGPGHPADISRRLLAEYSARLKTPGLSAAARARIQRTIQEIKTQMERAR